MTGIAFPRDQLRHVLELVDFWWPEKINMDTLEFKTAAYTTRPGDAGALIFWNRGQAMVLWRTFAVLGILLITFSIQGPAWSSEDFKIAVFPDDQSDKDLVLTGELKKPDGKGPFPAVVLLHTCGGTNDTFNEFWPEYLSSIGYASIAVDSFGPRDARSCSREIRNIKGKDRVARDRYFSRDAYGALDFLAK
jgi:hypothetical protein